jgi:glycosyltransferase involved in cell wall biosynthesis
MSAIPLKCAKKNGVPITIAHSHNSNQPKDKKYLLKLYFKRKIPKYADKLFACSKNSGVWMFGKKYSSDITIMRNAIDTSQYLYNDNINKEIRNKYNLGNSFIVGHVGRFNTQKNHTFLIDIFKSILKLEPNAKLMMIGDGDLRKSIEQKVCDYEISDSVIFTGIVDNVNEVAQCFDVYCFPSLFEGLSVAMVEMQAPGVKCVISNTISNDCVITNNVEMLSLDESPEKWAETLLKYKDNYKKLNVFNDVKNAKFDIKDNSIWLQEFYLNEYNKCR